MTTKFVTLSQLREGSYYNLIRFNHGIRMTHIMLGETDTANIKSGMNLGKLLQIEQYGRSYDPDIILHFQNESGKIFKFDPSFGSVEAYVKYDPDEMSKARIMMRVRILEEEIRGNDWALRPENVVLTQGIDLSGWAEGDN
jgi:hypothetical protein